MRKIPVFISCPTTLSDEQELKRKVITDILDDLQMEPRALGRGDYPKDYPLKEVYIIAKHCSGGIILGFEQLHVEKATRKRGTVTEVPLAQPISLPTPWNHLEAGILFGLKLPLLIFKEPGIEGGVFDYGISDAFVHTMPPAVAQADKIAEIRQVILKWFTLVSQQYNAY